MGPFAQIEDFILTALLGILAGLIFDYYQAILRGIRIKRCPQYILDMTVWILMIVIVGIALLIINQAEIRVYVFIAMLAGAVIYFRIFAHFLRQPVDALGLATAKLLKSFMRMLSKPFRLLSTAFRAKLQQYRQPPEDPVE